MNPDQGEKVPQKAEDKPYAIIEALEETEVLKKDFDGSV